jgi:rhamnosyltransferase
MSIVVAVVVSYHPDIGHFIDLTIHNRRQVDRMVVVDNGSESTLAERLAALNDEGIDIISLGENLGIAAAQNRGVARAIDLGAQYILLLDQDSEAGDGMVRELVAVAEEHRNSAAPVAAVACNYVDPRITDSRPFFRIEENEAIWFGCCAGEKSMQIDSAIASGTLVPIAAWRNVGGMREELFIDLVDIEWYFRARSKGFQCLAACNARMTHTLGDSIQQIGESRVSMHSALRNYYFFRNTIWLFGQPHTPPPWKRELRRQLVHRMLSFVTRTPLRVQYLKMASLGIWHATRRRLGRY